MHKILKLQHHRHSGRLLPHHHTSYRALGLLLGTVGILLLFAHQSATADTLFVRAKISAPLPTEPAIIISPTDGYQSTTSTIAIYGTCPAATPANIVVILEDTNALGSTPCQDDETFSIEVTLHAGPHVLGAQIYNFTEDAGPVSTPITATYTPPLPPVIQQPNTPSSPVTSSPVNHPFITTPQSPAPQTALEIKGINNNYTFGPNSPVLWQGAIQGGTAPYTLLIDWGDDTSSTYTVKDSDIKAFRHNYDAMQAFTITMKVTDATGASATTAYAATTAYIPSTTTTQYPSGVQFSLPNLWENNNMLRIYSAYALTALVVALIWFDARHLRPFAIAGHAHKKAGQKQQSKTTRTLPARRNRATSKSKRRKP